MSLGLGPWAWANRRLTTRTAQLVTPPPFERDPTDQGLCSPGLWGRLGEQQLKYGK